MQLRMWRPPEADIPLIPVPEGFTLREMREGEEADWCRCCLGADFGVAETSAEVYASKMGDETVKRENVFFVCRDDVPVGTACARNIDGTAYLHYIAVSPEARGNGLSKPLVSAVLRRHAEQGRLGCFLTTDDFRKAAVYTYLTIGYLPVLWTDDARRRWEKLLFDFGIPSVAAYDTAMRPAPDITARK